MKKFAIYTACIGGYDSITQPLVIDERFDYILFSDDVSETHVGVWQVRKVDYKNGDKTRIARWVKTHPHVLLSQYNATLWIDSSLQIRSLDVYKRFIELKNICEIAALVHPERDCIYDEAYFVSNRAMGPVEHDYTSIEWCHKLWKEKYPRHYGLCETGVLFRMNSEQIEKMNEVWWNCIENYSKRDQLSFNYALWKCNLKYEPFLKKKEDVRNSNLFVFHFHSNMKKKLVHMKMAELIRYRCNHISQREYQKYEIEWHKIYRFSYPVFILESIGWMKFAVFSPILAYNKIKHKYF